MANENLKTLWEWLKGNNGSSGIPSTGNQNAKKVFSTIPTSPLKTQSIYNVPNYYKGMTTENTGQRFSDVQKNATTPTSTSTVTPTVTPKQPEKKQLPTPFLNKSVANTFPNLANVPTSTTPLQTATPTPVEQPMSATEQYMSLLEMLPENSPEILALKEAAKKEAESKIGGFNQQINTYNQLKQDDVNLLNEQMQKATKNLDDMFFQRYLDTRQSMGNRGLYNSGLMADATTRLGMNRQDELANLYSTLQGNINELNKYYSPKISDLESQISGVSEDSIYSNKKQDFYDDRKSQAKAFLELLPYTDLTAKEKASLQLDYTKAFGTDANGNKTIDFKKLEETVRQNNFNNQVKGAQVQYQNANQNAKSLSNAEKEVQKIKNSEITRQIKGYTEKAKILESRINALDKQIATLPDGQAKDALYQERMNLQGQFNDAMDVITLASQGFTSSEINAAKGSTKGTTTTGAQKNTAKTPEQIARENELARKQGALKQFQNDVPRLQIKASDVNDKNAYIAIERLGSAGIKPKLTTAQLRKIEQLAKQEPGFLSGAAVKNQIRNAKKMLPLLQKYGYDIIG